MLRLTGLASGMDTDAVVQALLEAERIPIIRKESQIYEFEDKRAAWSQLDSKMTDLNSKAVKLNNYTTWQQKSASSTNEETFKATAGRDANNANYEVVVSNLAESHRVASKQYGSSQAGLSLSGSFTIGGQIVPVDTEDTLEDIRDSINTAANDMDSDKKVFAQIIDNKLVIERVETGLTDIEITDDPNNILNDMEIYDSSTSTFYDELQEGEQLTFSLNNMTITRDSNTDIDDVLEDVTLNFYKETESGDSDTLTVSNDKETIKGLIKDFITSYNEAMELAENASNVNLDDDDEDISTFGLLQGDGLVSTIKSRVRRIVTNLETDPNKMDQEFNSLQSIGIWTEGRENRLKIVDEQRLDDVLENNFDELEDLFRDFDSGVMRSMVNFTDDLISPVNGTIVQRQKNLEERINDLDDEIRDIENKLPKMEEELYERFAKMEGAMASINSAAGFVTSQIGKGG